MFGVLSSGWARLTQPFIPSMGREMNTKLAWRLKILEISLQTNHLIETSAHAPQHPRSQIRKLGTVGLVPHGL
ncbi:hypothetical protein TNCV_2237121 [Trichonephila clavipes]|nr:hypothetical protein TNCV_2237121 [Trichonephila clavipes]